MNFHRRAYWRVSDPNLILVHCLMVDGIDDSNVSTCAEYPALDFLDPLPSSTCDSDAPSLTMSEYSPEWDFCDGGSKVLICYSSNYSFDNLKVGFGQKIVDATPVMPGVLKCTAPPNSPGPVAIFLAY